MDGRKKPRKGHTFKCIMPGEKERLPFRCMVVIFRLGRSKVFLNRPDYAKSVPLSTKKGAA